MGKCRGEMAGRRTAATGVWLPPGGIVHAGCAPHSLFGLAQKENAPRPVEEKKALSALRCSGPPRATGVGVSVQAPIWPSLRARYALLRFLILPSRAGWCRGRRGARTHLVCFSFRAFRFATRCLGSRRGLVVEDDFAALGAAGGGDIRRRNKRAVLPAQMLCISGQVRRSGFPGLRQPIDPIVALQSAALHFRAAERTIQTNLLLFRYPQERDSGKPRVFPVLSPAAKEDSSIIFGRTCACRKFPDPGALGAVHQ